MSTKAKGYGFVYVPCTINEIVTKEISNKTDIDFSNANIHHRYLVKNPNIDFIKRDGARDNSICVVDDRGRLRFYSPTRNMCVLNIDRDEILQFKENNEWVSIYTFLVSEHSGGGGGGSGSTFPEAPNNNKIYGRKNRSWVEVKSPIEEDAPQDTFLYARSNGSWLKINNLSDVPNPTKKYLRKQGTWEEFKEDEFVKEANNDGKLYARKNGGWESVVSFPEAPNDTFSYVRKGNNWVKETKPIETDAPSDNSSYGRKDGNWEKINEFPEAPNDNATYVRKNKTWVRETIDTDVPTDNKQYVRKNGAWAHLDTQGTILEAPADGKYYARKDNDWSTLDDTFIKDVSNGKKYLRSKNNWVEFIPEDYIAKNKLTDNKFYAIKNDNLTEIIEFPEAPLDTNKYLRSNKSWVKETIDTDAPNDGKQYVRKNESWVHLDTAGTILEAENDGKVYGRKSKDWIDLDTLFIRDVIDTKKYIRSKTNWVEFDPDNYVAKNGLTDNKLYALKNDTLTSFDPFVDANSDTKYYARKDGSWEALDDTFIKEANNDSKNYGRNNKAWVDLDTVYIKDVNDTKKYLKTQSNWVEFEPNDYLSKNKLADDKFYGIKNDTLTEFTPFIDASSDTKYYGRKDGAWSDLDSVFVKDLSDKPKGLYFREKDTGDVVAWTKFDDSNYIKKEENVVIYMSNNGDDINQGTSDKPVKTFKRAFELIPDVTPGTVSILLLDGTYEENTITNKDNVFGDNGEFNKIFGKLVIKSEKDINPNVVYKFTSATKTYKSIFHFNNINNVEISNIKFYLTNFGNQDTYFVHFDSCKNSNVTKCEFGRIGYTNDTEIGNGLYYTSSVGNIKNTIINTCRNGVYSLGGSSVYLSDTNILSIKEFGVVSDSSIVYVEENCNYTLVGIGENTNTKNGGKIFGKGEAINNQSSNSEVVTENKTIFVSVSGDDGNDGSSKLKAVKTIHKAVELIPKVCTGEINILISPGTYEIENEIIIKNILSSNINIGADGGDVTIKATKELQSILRIENIKSFNITRINFTNKPGIFVYSWLYAKNTKMTVISCEFNGVNHESKGRAFFLITVISYMVSVKIDGLKNGIYNSHGSYLHLNSINGRVKDYSIELNEGVISKRGFALKGDKDDVLGSVPGVVFKAYGNNVYAEPKVNRGFSIYVSTEGNDISEGSDEYPVKTIHKAIEKIPSFSTDLVSIKLMPGTYNIDKSIIIGASMLPIISIESESGNNDVTLNFTGNNIENFIRVFDVNRFVLKNIKITHDTGKSITSNWIKLEKVSVSAIRNVTITETTSSSTTRGILIGEGCCDIEKAIINGCQIGVTAGTVAIVTLDDVSGTNKKYGYTSYGILKAKTNVTITGQTSTGAKENSGVIIDNNNTFQPSTNIPNGLTIFASPTGNDSNDGLDQTRPVRTIAKVIELLPKQATGEVKIKFAAGEYDINSAMIINGTMVPSISFEALSGNKDVTFNVKSVVGNAFYIKCAFYVGFSNIKMIKSGSGAINDAWFGFHTVAHGTFNKVDITDDSSTNYGIVYGPYGCGQLIDCNINGCGVGILAGTSTSVTVTRINGINNKIGALIYGSYYIDSAYNLKGKIRDIENRTGSISGSNYQTGIETTSRAIKYYVSPTGNDNNSGTDESPFKTIYKAISMIPNYAPNIEYDIILHNGNYVIDSRIDVLGKNIYALNIKSKTDNFNNVKILLNRAIDNGLLFVRGCSGIFGFQNVTFEIKSGVVQDRVFLLFFRNSGLTANFYRCNFVGNDHNTVNGAIVFVQGSTFNITECKFDKFDAAIRCHEVTGSMINNTCTNIKNNYTILDKTTLFKNTHPANTPLDKVNDHGSNIVSGSREVDKAIMYVSNNGNDTIGNGTQAKPYRNISKCLSSLPYRDWDSVSIIIPEGFIINEHLDLSYYENIKHIKNFVVKGSGPEGTKKNVIVSGGGNQTNKSTFLISQNVDDVYFIDLKVSKNSGAVNINKFVTANKVDKLFFINDEFIQYNRSSPEVPIETSNGTRTVIDNNRFTSCNAMINAQKLSDVYVRNVTLVGVNRPAILDGCVLYKGTNINGWNNNSTLTGGAEIR